MKKRWIIPLVFTVFLIALIGHAVRFLKDDVKPKVIVVVQRLDIEYWKTFESGAKKAFHDFGIDGKVIAPDSLYPITNQPNLLKKVLKQNPDALIVSPTYPSVVNPVLMEFKHKNIPVFLTTTDAKWEYQTAYIGTDNLTLGKTAGKLLGSMLQPGDQVAIILGRVDDPVMIDRKTGAEKVLEDAGIEIVIEQSGYDHFGNPKSVIEMILQTYPNLKGVVATTDRVALEELKVIEEKALKIPVVGTDGLTEMVEYVEAGKIGATVAQNPYDMGYLSVEQAQKAIRGGNIQKKIDSGIDIITEDNAKEKLDFLQEVLH
ncbi:sugar ABC transporter substrate-binding protein [Priestia abyssalis]|uniref:sugar ABC transporter substrate-binding protein n=1 Tax=Priestia abyssalis TaxID=1221450 RepID=UPI001473C409|nr:sugar ABC transporter substrate-binding protein [Priestia abyssalis]